MHYYQHNIADYRKDTAHLSLLEHGIYRQILDTYYLDENPIETHLVIRRLSIKTKEELEALDNVLADFFIKSECGNFYNKKRCDAEITKYRNNISAKAKAGIASAKARKQKTAERKQNLTPVELRSTNQEPRTINQEPRTILKDSCDSQKKSESTSSSVNFVKPKKKQVPYQEIVDLYHKEFKDFPQVEKLTQARRSYIKKLYLDELPDSEAWKDFFDYIKLSDFLMGKVPPPPDRKLFRPNLEWLTKPANFLKILEGNYHE